MKKRLSFISIIVVLVLAILACGGSSGGSGDDTSLPSNAIFQDDFSDTGSGWDSIRVDNEGMTDYDNGVYRIQVLTTNTNVWANPGKSNISDAKVEVDATKYGGPDNNVFGVICRYEDENNFYYFVISSDGYYGIGKVINGEQVLIDMEGNYMVPTDTINQGAAINHIRGDCVGSTLTLYVNGQQVDSKTDTDLTSGDVGLMAGTFDEAGTDITFDNFQVLKP
jgi:hypothetical protein